MLARVGVSVSNRLVVGKPPTNIQKIFQVQNRDRD